MNRAPEGVTLELLNASEAGSELLGRIAESTMETDPGTSALCDLVASQMLDAICSFKREYEDE